MKHRVPAVRRDPTFNSADFPPVLVLGEEFPVVVYGAHFPAITDLTKNRLDVSYVETGLDSPGAVTVVHANTRTTSQLDLILRIDDLPVQLLLSERIGIIDITITITLVPAPDITILPIISVETTLLTP